MKLAEITPISSFAAHNLGGTLTKKVELMAIQGDKLKLRPRGSKDWGRWYTEGKDVKLLDIT